MTIHPSLQKLIALIALASLAAGCDSTVGTTANPDLSSISSGYNGPPARTADIRSFELNFWNSLKEEDRCGQCHGAGQTPEFVDGSDVNRAYSEAMSMPYADLANPSQSFFVTYVGGGHNCWLTGAGSDAICAQILTNMISNWASSSNITTARLIQLTPPAIKDPGDAKSFPSSASTPGTLANNNPAFASNSFEDTVHKVLIGDHPGTDPNNTNNCQACHEETAMPLPIAPFFANADTQSAYENAQSKMDIDTPAISRLVVRLREESHNCWTTDCDADADVMQAAIEAFADGIEPTQVAQGLITSKALNLGDGIVAAGGNRHESNLVALWEFKESPGSPLAFDTSGIDPAVDLALTSTMHVGVTQMAGYGLDFTGGMARADPFDSDKLQDFIQASGEYAVEAWVIPSNVTQEDAHIIGYSGSDTLRNFTLAQRMYNYDFYNRSNLSDTNGEPFFTSDDNNDNEILQASLQHVVVNYDPITGREIYVNGTLVPGTTEPTPGVTTINNAWQDTYAFVLGNEVSGNRPWRGKIRMAAVHNRTLTAEQVLQNFDVGVGEKYFLLFYIGHQIGIADSYIMMEVAQFDSYSYLFTKPTFINLDPNWTPAAINITGMRIGINGKEAVVGQAFANINETIGVTNTYDPQLGQLLSPLGTVIALEKGSSDEFFLTFETLGGQSLTPAQLTESIPSVSSDPQDPGQVDSDIGVRTFDEINATISAITGIPVTNGAMVTVYDEYIQQLPSVESIDAFLPSHQMAITQLALTSCSELVDNNPGFFTNFTGFGQNAYTVFGSPEAPLTRPPYPTTITVVPSQPQLDNRNAIIGPLLTAALNVNSDSSKNLTSQPDESEISGLLGASTAQQLDTGANLENYDSLFTKLINTCTPVSPAITCTPANTPARTAQIVKGVCAAVTGAAVMLVQ